MRLLFAIERDNGKPKIKGYYLTTKQAVLECNLNQGSLWNAISRKIKYNGCYWVWCERNVQLKLL